MRFVLMHKSHEAGPPRFAGTRLGTWAMSRPMLGAKPHVPDFHRRNLVLAIARRCGYHAHTFA